MTPNTSPKVSPKTSETLSAFSPGCELWIVTDPMRSQWSRRIDWYLNFQFQKAESHHAKQFPSELLRVMQEAEFESDFSLQEALGPDLSQVPLMIASSELLPNRQTVLIPFKSDSAHWVSDCRRVWEGLGRPSARVFLPESLEPEFFRSRWAKASSAPTAADLIQLISD